jgi:hypothetical protein
MTPQDCLTPGLYRHSRCFKGVEDGVFAVLRANAGRATGMLQMDAKLNRRIVI